MRPHAPHAFGQWAKEMPGATLRPKPILTRGIAFRGPFVFEKLNR